MITREQFIEERYQTYASPSADAFYNRHAQLKTTVQVNPVLANVVFFCCLMMGLFFVSCAVKTDSHDWFKIGIALVLIIGVYGISSITMSLQA